MVAKVGGRKSHGVEGKLPVPALILWGDGDRLTHVSGAAILESLMPSAKAIVMKSMGHIPMMQDPLSTAGYYIEFCKKEQ